MQLRAFITETSVEFIGMRLRMFRSVLGQSASEMAIGLSVGLQQWQHWESGICPPSLAAMINLAERSDLSLDYIYRGDMSRLPSELSRALRKAVHQILEEEPHPLWHNDRVQLLARWKTNAEHHFTTNSTLGGVLRDDQGRGVVYPYSPIGKTRWELSDGDPGSLFWRTHISDLDACRPFHDFRYPMITRAGRSIWVVTSGRPEFKNGTFVGYSGIGWFVSRESFDRQVA